MPFPRTSRRNSLAVRRHPGSGGFSLVELLTSIAVLAILMSITISAVRGTHTRANIARARGDLAAFTTALEDYKRLYGDYPQTGEFQQAPATPTGVSTTLPNGQGPGVNTAQAKLFNCLAGVFGPKAFSNSDRLSGPNFLPAQLMDAAHLNGIGSTGLPANFLVPVNNAPNPPTKTEQNFSVLDPWGRRYLYYYKNARQPNNWQAPAYVLYSAGPNVAANGTQTVPINATTGLLLASQTAEMLDNIPANP